MCDSIVKYQTNVIIKGDSILSLNETRFTDLSTLSSEYKKERDIARKKLKLSIWGFPVGIGIGALTVILLR